MDKNFRFDPIVLIIIAICLIPVILSNILSNPYSFTMFAIGLIFFEYVTFISKNIKTNIILINFCFLILLILLFYLTNYLLINYLFHQINNSIVISKIFHTAIENFSIELFKFNLTFILIGLVTGLIKQLFFLKHKISNNTFFDQVNLKYEFSNIKNNDFFIGKTDANKKVFLTENNFDHHTQIIGGSGSGKTNLIKNIIEDRIKLNKAIIFLDYKAESNLESWILKTLEKYNRKHDYSLFSLSKPEISFNYNPISTGDIGQITSKIMESLNWSEVFYQKYSHSCLNKVIEYLMYIKLNHNLEFSLHDVKRIISSKSEYKKYEKHFNVFIKNTDLQEDFESSLYSDNARRNLAGFISDLDNICRSALGNNLISDNALDLREMIKQKKFIYLQMNSMLDGPSSKIIGKIILKDLIFQVGLEFLNEDPNLDCTLIIDEFAEFATTSFSELINRCRGARLQIIVAHQSSGDLDKVSPFFSNQIETNTANKIIFGTSLHNEAEKFSKYLGTKKTTKLTHQTSKTLLFGETETDRGSIRDVEEFLIHPNIYKNLKRGQAVVIKRIVDIGYAVVNLPKASD